MFSDYDKDNLDEILAGHGDWMEAYTLRYLNVAISKADKTLLPKLFAIWPEEFEYIYRHWGWEEKSIEMRIDQLKLMAADQGVFIYSTT